MPCVAGRGGEGLSISGKIPLLMICEAKRRHPARGLRLRRTKELIKPRVSKGENRYSVRLVEYQNGSPLSMPPSPDRRSPAAVQLSNAINTHFSSQCLANLTFLISRALTPFRNIQKEFYYSGGTARTCVMFPGLAYYSNGAWPHCRRTNRTPPKGGAPFQVGAGPRRV